MFGMWKRKIRREKNIELIFLLKISNSSRFDTVRLFSMSRDVAGGFSNNLISSKNFPSIEYFGKLFV